LARKAKEAGQEKQGEVAWLNRAVLALWESRSGLPLAFPRVCDEDLPRFDIEGPWWRRREASSLVARLQDLGPLAGPR